MWKKGQSGNPRGRPRRQDTFADEIRKQAKLRDPESRKTARAMIIEKLIELALDGNIPAARTLLEWSDGKPAAVQLALTREDTKLYITVSPDDWDNDTHDIQTTALANPGLAE